MNTKLTVAAVDYEQWESSQGRSALALSFVLMAGLLELTKYRLDAWFWAAFAVMIILGLLNSQVVRQMTGVQSAPAFVFTAIAWPVSFLVATALIRTSAIWLRDLSMSTVGTYGDYMLTVGAYTVAAGLIGAVTVFGLVWSAPVRRVLGSALIVGIAWALILVLIGYVSTAGAYLAGVSGPLAFILAPLILCLGSCAIGYANNVLLAGVVARAKR